MKLDSFEAVAAALNEARVRYLVAGGLAVNAHGYLRFTADIDLVVALERENIVALFDALASLGYRPTVPIRAEELADPALRGRWFEEKGMRVLNFFSDSHRVTSVDVFVYEPFDFEEEYSSAFEGEIRPGLVTRFVSIPTLIRMKEEAGRPRDADDIQHLRWILEDEERQQ